MLIYNPNNQLPKAQATTKKKSRCYIMKSLPDQFLFLQKVHECHCQLKTHAAITSNSIKSFKMSIVTFFKDPEVQFLGSTLKAEHGRDEGRTLKRLENRLLEVIVAFYRMFTRYLAGAFKPKSLTLKLKVRPDLQPGDLIIIGLLPRFKGERPYV